MMYGVAGNTGKTKQELLDKNEKKVNSKPSDAEKKKGKNQTTK